MADNGAARYTVTPLTEVLDRFKGWAEVAARNGVRDWYAAALRHINRQLTHRPTEWGDPLFTYRGLRLQMFQGVHEQFVVVYGVHTDRPVVFVRNVMRMRDEPLDDGREGAE